MSRREIDRIALLRFRAHAQDLTRPGEHADTRVLDLGVQDTGPDGSGWALELRGTRIDPADLVLAWTLRGAPHAYRRSEAAAVAAATAPYDETDAAKRIFDASRPLRQAGIPVLDALAHVADEMAAIAGRRAVVKGEMSAALTERLDDPYLRWCTPCQATHAYEQPFRLAALQAGLELEPGTSPPVLRRIPGWRGPAKRVPARLDPIRAVLRLLGPATPKQVAEYVEAPVAVVRARWPEDVEPVVVAGETRHVLVEDLDALLEAPVATGVRLLGPFDLFLQGRDRATVVPDESARQDLWRTLGRPGGLLVDGEVVGSWRPRAKGRRLQLAVTRWDGGALPTGLDDQAERLATFRGQAFAGYVDG